MRPEGKVQSCGPRKVVAGRISQGQDHQKKPWLSLGAKSDLQSVLQNKKLRVLSMRRAAFTGESNVLG